MGRFLIDELRGIEGAAPDLNALSAKVVKLILSSRQIEAKVYDSDPRTGVYVLVLEGILEIGEREQVTRSRDRRIVSGDPMALGANGDAVTSLPVAASPHAGTREDTGRPEA